MVRQSRPEGTSHGAKGELIDKALRSLPKYQRELVRDLVHGAVAVPRTWLSPADGLVVTLDEGSLLDSQQRETCRLLLDWAIHLVGEIIRPLIEQDIADRRAAGHPPSRQCLETLRRGRGPAAVRNLLFERLDHWPHEVPDLVDEVHQMLDLVLLRRAAYIAPTSVAGQTVALMKECRGVVQEYAARKGLDSKDTDILISDVMDQLVRNAGRGELPHDLRAWTLGTAKWKWQALLRSRQGRPSTSPFAPREPMAPDDIGDLEARLDVIQWLLDAARALSTFAERLAAIEGDRATIAAHRAAAVISQRGDVELVLAVIEESAEGLQVIDDELAHQGQDLSRARRTAVQRIVRDALRQAWQRNQDADARESS